ncbi:MAG: beta strand repeat-containing protein [Terriglobia bacterium]
MIGGKSSSSLSLLNVGGAAPATLVGTYSLWGNTGGALLSYGSGQITSIGEGNLVNFNKAGYLSIVGANAFVQSGGQSGNSALNGLREIANPLSVLGLSDGASVTTSGALTNNGYIGVGSSGDPNGTSLHVGGNLTNAGMIQVGSNSTMTVNGTLNDTGGELVVYGGVSGGNSTVTVAGSAPSVLTGSIDVQGPGLSAEGDAVLNYAGGGEITQLGDGGVHNGYVDLEGTNVFVESAGASGNSALKNLATIDTNSQLVLARGATLTTSGSLAINGGVLFVGDNYSGKVSTLNVNGNITQAGGGDSTTGTDIILNGVINVGDGSFTQSGNTTRVNGTLKGANVVINGGALFGTGNITGNVTVGSSAEIGTGASKVSGTLNISGSLTLDGTLQTTIDYSGAGALNIGGSLTLGPDSSLAVSLNTPAYTSPGTQFTIATFSGMPSGTFGPIANNTFNGGTEYWTLGYNDGSLVLTAMSATTTVTATWKASSGNWANAGEWSCEPGAANCVPNNGTPPATPPATVYEAVTNSPGNTLTVSGAESVATLTLKAGTLDIAPLGTLNLTAEPGGITDIPAGSGLAVEGHFGAGSTNGLADLTSLGGSLKTDNGLTTFVAPTGSAPTLTIADTGSLSVASVATNLILNGSISTAGAVTVASGATLQPAVSYVQSAGTTDIDGTLWTGNVEIAGGSLTGTGKLIGNFSNSGGVVEPGGAGHGGVLTITTPPVQFGVPGSFTQGSGGTLMEQIFGGAAGEYGVLDIGGTASLAGTLDINLNNFLPGDDEQFVILDATGGLSGTFPTINGLDFGPGNADFWSIAYGPNTVTLTANVSTTSPTPEPASLLLFGTGLIGFGWLARRTLRAQA